jgi:hypothetical protein
MDRETLANQMLAISHNIAFNLDFIPADKLFWKPAPDANSALEIVHHVLGAVGSFTAPGAAVAPVTELADAKARVVQAGQKFADALRAASPEELAEVGPPMGLARGHFAALLVVDTINHHGQITYIQTMLGDLESHFAPDVIGYLV